MIASLLLAALALADDQCTKIGFGDIVSIPAPAVIVLGERHGTQPDLARAARVVKSLRQRAPVRVALEAVHFEGQPVLDDYAAQKIPLEAVPEDLHWERTWGFPFAPYEPLITASSLGAEVIGAGLDLGPRPAAREVPIPDGYMNILQDAVGAHSMPIESEARFVESMAWRDFRMSELATAGWDGKGYLVVVVGRGHVEGSLGVPWQIARMTTAPVHAFTLAWGGDPPCYRGDKVWRPSVDETIDKLLEGDRK